jgi:predicted RNase H-like HicB family nuclease
MRYNSFSFTVLIEQDEDDMYIAKVPDIPGCYTQGQTVEQAMERVREAIQVCLETEKGGIYSVGYFKLDSACL